MLLSVSSQQWVRDEGFIWYRCYLITNQLTPPSMTLAGQAVAMEFNPASFESEHFYT